MSNEILFKLLERLEREYPECRESNEKMKKKIQKIYGHKSSGK